MQNEEKTREQLLAENESLRAKLSELHKVEGECRWVEAALRESEERYKRLLESITDYIYTVKVESGRPVSTSHGLGCLAVTGYTSEHYQMYPNLWYEMIHEEDRKAVLDQAEKLLKGEAVQPLEHRIIHKDGSIRWVRNTPVPHYDKNGKLIFYDGIIEDITERKKAEEALYKTGALLKLQISRMPVAYIVWDTSFRVVSWNPAAERIFGFTSEEAIGKHPYELIVPKEAQPHVDIIWRRLIDGDTTAHSVNENLTKDGRTIICEWSNTPLRYHNGDVIGALSMVQDITERKKAEEALELAKKEWEATFDGITDPLFIHDREFRVVRANRAYADAAGVEFKDLIGRPYYEVYPKMEGPFKMCLKARELQEEEEEEEEEEEFSCPLTNRIFKVKFYPIKDVNGGYLYSIHILEDITEAKRSEEKIKEAELRYRTIFEQSPAGILIIDPETVLPIEFNDTACRQLGYSREEFANLHVWDYEVIDSPEQIKARAEKLLREGKDSFETKHRTKNGEIRNVLVTIQMLMLSGKPLLYCIFRDITNVRRSEERIKEEMEITSHLLMIAEATAHTTDIDRLMEQVVHCVQKIIRCDICLSYLWDDESKVFQPCQAFGLSRDMIPLFRTGSIDEKMEFVRKAVERKEPVVVQVGENPPQSPFYKEGDKVFPPLAKGGEGGFLKDISTLSAAIPLIGKAGTLGLIVGIYSHPVELTERDKKIMVGICQQVSVALEQARLYKESVDKTLELSHKIETIKVMHEIDRSILSTLRADEVLETVTRLIAKVIPCERATVALVDRERGGLIYKAGFGTAIVPKGAFVPFADTSIRVIVETGRTECVNNLSEMTQLLPIEKRLLDEGFFSHIRVPITIKGDVAGILTVGAKRVAAFTKENLSTLEYLCSQIGVALSNARLISDLEELFIGVVKSLSSAIDAKSPWTSGHSERVTKYALDIAKEMGLPEKELKDLELAGLLHDVGKIGTYETILDKPARLNDEEQAVMRLHPVKGAEILAPIKQLKDIIPGVKYHHEFYDGTGYPEGLKRDEIPLLARILAVADTFDAMSADRPYRTGRTMEFMISELKRCSGTQFDPKVAEAFLEVIGEREEFEMAAS